MARKILDSTKIKRGYGTGHHNKYKPFIRTSEFNSQGTCSNPIDWKTGRTVHLLSQGEKYIWYILRFMDEVDDIREQYPLELEETTKIAELYGIMHPKTHLGPAIMTTDMLVDTVDGKQYAISVKNSRKDIEENDRTIEKQFIECEYWKRKNVKFILLYKDEMNLTYARNIEAISYFYRYDSVYDDVSFLKYLIVNKYIIADMKNKTVDFVELSKQYITHNGIKQIKNRLEKSSSNKQEE